MYDELARVNIHNKGLIPFLNMVGPIYNIGISWPLYNRLKDDPTVIIYPVSDDPYLEKLRAEREIQKKKELMKVVEEKTVIKEVFEVSKEEVLITEKKEVNEEIEVVTEKEEVLDIDLEIDMKLAEVELEEDTEVVHPTEEDLIEIQEHLSFKRYTYDDLKEKTKAQLKYILNIERSIEPGTKYYGGYHDTHPELIEFVLKTQ